MIRTVGLSLEQLASGEMVEGESDTDILVFVLLGVAPL